MMLMAKAEMARRRQAGQITSLRALEFKVFSQFGDDGILASLADLVPVESQRFIEFGVENYVESNTRLLLEMENWSGLIIDGSPENMRFVRDQPNFWKYDLTAVAAFVTKQNINDLFTNAGYRGQVGILSIDIDGNDYWVWEAIEAVDPLIVVCEYNAIFGKYAFVSVPYDANFRRSEKHFSHLYFGASLQALNFLAERKGLQFIGCNSAGNNAYFVNPKLNWNGPYCSVEEGFVHSRFREGRDANGNLALRKATDLTNALGDLPLVDVRSHSVINFEQIVQAMHG